MQTFIFGLFVSLQATQETAYKLQVRGEMGVRDEGGYPPLSIGVNSELI
jgi:hypothetical protein